MLLILPLRDGDDNEELRYALRTWETNLILPGGLTLLTVGYRPAWLAPDQHIDGNRHKSMPFAVFDNIRLGSWVSENTPEALYMNDDFFCLDPVGAVLPVRRDCTLAEHISMFPVNAGTWWPHSLRLTASWLAEQGFPHPYSFEVHRPLLASPSLMFEALSRWERGTNDTVPQWRTVYGTISRVHAYPVHDAKLGPRALGVGTPWISTSDQSWRRYAGPIRLRFQKPSRWEI